MGIFTHCNGEMHATFVRRTVILLLLLNQQAIRPLLTRPAIRLRIEPEKYGVRHEHSCQRTWPKPRYPLRQIQSPDRHDTKRLCAQLQKAQFEMTPAEYKKNIKRDINWITTYTPYMVYPLTKNMQYKTPK